MVWNIEFQIAGLLLSVVVCFMCLGQRHINFKSDKTFAALLIGVICCTTFDILSVIAINLHDTIGKYTEVFCEVYLFSIVVVAFLSARFSAEEIRFPKKQYIEYLSYVPLVVELVALVVFETNFLVNEETKELYSFGFTVNLTYAFCFIYLLSCLLVTVFRRKEINLRKRKAIYFWMISWIATAMIQFFNNQLLIVTFAMAIAITYMYCKLENPEYHLDLSDNVFNRKGFSMLLDECVNLKRKIGIVTFTLHDMDSVTEIFGSGTISELLHQVCDYLANETDNTLFRIDDSMFCIAVENESEIPKVMEYVSARFKRPWDIHGIQILLKVSLSYIPDTSKYQDPYELEEVVHYFSLESVKLDLDEPLEVTDEWLEKRKRIIEGQHALEWAMNHDAVEMYYQPIYNIEAGKFTSMEALVRVKDKDGNIIYPNDFIEFAEKNGFILRLGDMIFRKVCEFVAHSNLESYGIEYVEVNLSVVQCMQETLARDFKNIMAEYLIAPHMINLEITETAAIHSHDVFQKNMRELLAYGTSFSLDDYGSGYSNLEYIVNMPVNIIKIDRQLTISYSKSEKAKTAIEYTIEMIHKLGMKIVVEGVETEEVYLAFKRLGVEFIQGYYFSKPLPKDRLLNYIQEWM